MSAVITINAKNLVWNCSKTPANVWLGICDMLKLTMEGDTYQELIDNINDGVQTLLLDLLQSGDLPDFLKERGWSQMPIRVPTTARRRDITFDLPMSFIPAVVHKKKAHDRSREIA